MLSPPIVCAALLFAAFSLRLAAAGESPCTIPNTGSVLFRTIDLDRRHCWSREELATLYTRRAVMELLPRRIPHSVQLLMEYMQMALTVLKEMAPNKLVYDYTLAALADAFGGYLQAYGLPLAHEAYYEGYVAYDTAAQFHRLQDGLKGAVATGGDGWARPMEVRKRINRILPLKTSGLSARKPCALLFTDVTGPSADDDGNQTSTLIPLPILDDNRRPHSIGVPFRDHALYDLKSRSSYDILIKYYVEATRCISKASQGGREQTEFDEAFQRWLRSKVIPRLRDEEWYVGFSNVLRIDETISQKGGIVAAGRPRDADDDSLFAELESNGNMNNPWYLLFAVLVLLSVLLICFLYWAFIKRCCCFACCRKGAGYSEDGEPHSDCESLLPSAYPSTQRLVADSSATTVGEENKITLSCGLGRRFRDFKRCSRHEH